MTKAICYSLFGNRDMYNQGAIENAKSFRKYYPDFEMVVCYSKDTDVLVLNELVKNGVFIKDMSDSSIDPYFWRFLEYDNYDICIFRDCDSRLSLRESTAVETWLNSNKKIHVMIDHPAHKVAYGANQESILAGMWGIRKDTSPSFDLIDMISKFHSRYPKMTYGYDQYFLKDVYNNYKDSCFIHDFEGKYNKFEIPRENYHFIGERFDANNKRTNDYKQLM